jgi:hypothetical protein
MKIIFALFLIGLGLVIYSTYIYATISNEQTICSLYKMKLIGGVNDHGFCVDDNGRLFYPDYLKKQE